MRSPSRRADRPREITEAERLDWMRGPHDQKSPEIFLSLWLSVRWEECLNPGRGPKNLSESIGLSFFVTCDRIS